MCDLPHVPREKRRRIILRNGVLQGNPASAPRCHAKTRKGGKCLQPAMRGKKRCRLHGGQATGARTEEGRERVRIANWKHGYYSVEDKEQRQWIRDIQEKSREFLLRLTTTGY